jgi:formate dehydrogenase subunit gamma
VTESDTVRRIIADLKGRPGQLLEVLHAMRVPLGHVPPGSVPRVAEAPNLSRFEVHGVVTFYHGFRHAGLGRQSMSICLAEGCQAMGALALAVRAKQRSGVGFHQTMVHGRCFPEPIHYPGNCACSPAVMINGRLHGRMSPEQLDLPDAGERAVR